jgi:pSer/pThr/pTyr-binding forkhead associated (FHA) protein
MPAGTKVQLRLGERVVAEVAFEGAELRIGRMKENDLVINNLAVSRFHAVLRRMGTAFEIEDLGSENGTFVDGVAVQGTAVVPDGAAITIGKHTLQLRSGSAEGGARPPRAPLSQSGRSDVWDAAQTYFVAAPAPRAAEPEEAVAVAVEAERDEDGLAEAVEAMEEPASPAALRLPPSRADAPALLELPDADGPLAFGEDELVGAAAPDPAAAEAAVASVEPAELEPLEELAGADSAGPAPLRIEPGAQTALFDFGLTDDLGLSDGSLARAARRSSPAPAPARAAVPAPSHAGLIVERLGRVERVVPWGAGELVAGRAPDCDVVLAASGVSRRHARFVREDDAFRVIDLGSANGIRVNGRQLDSSPLAVGDMIAIDDYTITFVLDREPVDGVVCAAAAPARATDSHTVLQAGASEAIPERDLVLDADESAPLDAEKQLESAAAPVERVRAAAVGDASWRFEITLAADRLPAALRRALEELGEDELRLPVELRWLRRD